MLRRSLALVVSLLAVSTVQYAQTKPTTLPGSSGPVKLTMLPGSERQPTFSPDGGQVAFTWQRDAGQGTDVWLQSIGAAGTPTRLTNDGATHTFASWSPDGKSIALWHTPPAGGGAVSLNIVSPAGGPERRVRDWTGTTGRISWSGDSKWMAVSPVGNNTNLDQGLIVISPETGNQIEWAKLNQAFTATFDPAFSPDGRQMAYVRGIGAFSGSTYIVSVDADGRPSGEPRLLRLPGYAGRETRYPAWTSKGEEILLIAGDATSNGEVVRVRADGSRPPQPVDGLDHVTTLGLSRDGTRLAFSRGAIDSDIWRVDLQNKDRTASIARSAVYDGGAEYSPDGKRIVFSSNRGGGREIWVADANGDSARVLTKFGGPIAGTAHWSPNGQDLTFDSRPGGNSDIFVVSASGGQVRQLTTEPGEDARPAWSAKGDWIFFSSDRAGRNEIWRMRPDGREPSQVTHTSTGVFNAMASPDGQWLYYRPLTAPFYLHRVRVDGTDDAELVREVNTGYAFMPTTRGLYFVASPNPTQERPYYSVQFWNTADRSLREVAKLEFAAALNLSVSPDDRYLLLTRPDMVGTDLLLVPNFK